jgi:hypothetical protein
MFMLLGGCSNLLHPVVEDEAEQQNDEEINQRKRGSGPQIKLPNRFLREVLA